LEDSGFRVTAVANGRLAVEAVKGDHDFDVVVLDMIMPEMNGAACLGELRRAAPQLPVLMASGYSLPQSGETLRPDGFLQKPYTGRELTRKVSEMISRGAGKRRASGPIAQFSREAETVDEG